MVTTTAQTTDLAQVIVDAVAGIDGLRCYAYVADTVRTPAGGAALVVMQPTVDYTDQLAGFCSASWSFPLSLVTTRANEREAQAALSRYLQLVTSALSAAQSPPGVASVEPIDARPTAVTVSGVDQPGYTINVRIRA